MRLAPSDDSNETLQFPFSDPPAFGALHPVGDGIFWLRIPLPYQLDHVNIYLIREEVGWVVIDTGIQTKAAIAVWEDLFAGPLKGERISRVIVTHHHPDHIGLAGWLCAAFDAPLLTSYASYMGSQVISFGSSAGLHRHNLDFYTSHGMSPEGAEIVASQGNDYLRRVSELPRSFQRLVASDRIEIGARSFQVITGNGHAPEQIMLYCAEEKLLFAADQVIERISPNISVFANEPDGDPLGRYLESLAGLQADIPNDVLVLPGHRRPFFGLHDRIAVLQAHHMERCDLIVSACAKGPHSVAELVPILFPRPLDPHQMSFAFTETLAHLNRLVHRGDIVTRQQGDLRVNITA